MMWMMTCRVGQCVVFVGLCHVVEACHPMCRWNHLGAEGAKALVPALGLLTGLEELNLE